MSAPILTAAAPPTSNDTSPRRWWFGRGRRHRFARWHQRPAAIHVNELLGGDR